MSILSRAADLLVDVIDPAVFAAVAPLEIAARHLPGEPVAYDEAVVGPFAPFDLGGPWGPAWGTTWFRLRGDVPASWAGQEVALRFEMTPPAEGLLWQRGEPRVGLSWLRRDAVLLRRAEAVEPVECYVEAAGNPAVPPHETGPDWPLLLADPGGPPQFRLTRCELAARDTEVYGLACDPFVAESCFFEAAFTNSDFTGNVVREL